MAEEEQMIATEVQDLEFSTKGITDKIKDVIADKISEITDGQLDLDLLKKGQIRIDGNAYVDKVLQKLNLTLDSKGLSNVPLPQQQLHFEKSVACGIVLPGDANLDNGSISGLSSFSRMNEAAINIDVFSDPIITAGVEIGVERAGVDYGVDVEFLCFTQAGAVMGVLKDVKVSLGFKVSRDFSVFVDKFDVKYTGDLSMNFKELDAFMELTDAIDADLRTNVKEAVMQYLSKHVKSIITSIIASLGLELEK